MATLYVGTQDDPEQRTKIEVSDEDMETVARLKGLEGARFIVRNQVTGHDAYLKTADCGCSCYCAVDFA